MSVPQLSDLFYNASYDPGASLLTYTSIYGNDTTLSFHELETLIHKRMIEAIMFGVRCGAASITLIIMWLVTKNKRTPIFTINQISLVLIVIHSALYFSYLLSHLSSVTFMITGFPQYITRNNIHLYGAANIFQVLLVASIETSLVFQVKVIFTGDNFKKMGRLALFVSSALGLATVAMYFVTAIKGMIATYKNVNSSDNSYFNISTILLASSINLMSVILAIKLIMAIRMRRFLGLKQFDSFHILLIMCLQSLIVPSILFILSYSLPAGKGTDVLITVGTLLVVLSLPLSSMWATASSQASVPSSFGMKFSSDEEDGSNASVFSKANTLNTEKASLKGAVRRFYSRSSPLKRDKITETTKSIHSQDKENDTDYHTPTNKTRYTPRNQHYLSRQKNGSINSKNMGVASEAETYTPTTAAGTAREGTPKYWAGNISLNEGASLSKSLASEDIPDELLYMIMNDDEFDEELTETKGFTIRKTS